MKQQAKKRNYGERVDPAGETYRDKVMSIADYASTNNARELATPNPKREDIVRDPVYVPAPTRRDEQFVDFDRVAPMGAAVPLRDPLPRPLGLNPLYDDDV
jgi:hypothetical protein